MTPATSAELRDRVRARIGETVDTSRPCEHCGGDGVIGATGPRTANMIARQAGLSPSSMYSFMAGRSLLADGALRLAAWLARLEGDGAGGGHVIPAALLAQLEDVAAAPIPYRALGRHVEEAALSAGITAALDNRDRPLRFANGGGK